MPTPRVAHALFCDDIREETGNKFSLMGVYSGEIIFTANPPVMVPKFGIVTWVITDVIDPVKVAAVSIKLQPGGVEVFRTDNLPITMVSAVFEGASKMMAQQVLPLPPMVIQEAGSIEVDVVADGQALRAGRLIIRFNNKPG